MMVEENARKRIEINRIKSHVMVFSKNLTEVSYSIAVNGADLGQVDRFTYYLVNMLTVDGKPDEEIKRVIGIAKAADMKIEPHSRASFLAACTQHIAVIGYSPSQLPRATCS